MRRTHVRGCNRKGRVCAAEACESTNPLTAFCWPWANLTATTVVGTTLGGKYEHGVSNEYVRACDGCFAAMNRRFFVWTSRLALALQLKVESRLELLFGYCPFSTHPSIRVQQWSAGYGFVSMVPDEAGITLSGMATAGMNSAGISCDEQTLLGSKCVHLPPFF
jgi:hypothetical protein